MSLTIHLQHFQARVLQDALTEATAAYWDRRAAQFKAVGTYECDQTALACHRHAQLIRDASPEPISEDVRAALEELT